MSSVVLIGSDPEVFVVNNGVVGSAIGLVPGSKAKPHKTQHGWVQPDNVLAEFNISPAASAHEFRASLKAVLQDLRQFVPEVSIRASHEYSRDELLSFGREAFVFGCDPDFCAWEDGAPNNKPDDVPPGLRTAGGHLHVGYLGRGEDEPFHEKLRLIKAMDVTLGLRSVLLDPDRRRKMLYGKAGCFRPKKYGVEYRTLSNFWLSSDELMTWAFDKAQEAFRRKDEINLHLDAGLGMIVRNCIDTGDETLAAKLCEEFKV